jgi:polysaccharide chain length determinant protein (PEP-CTERM system associated)
LNPTTEFGALDERAGRDFLEYLEIPLRYPRYVIIPLLLALAAAAVLVVTVPRKYRSSTLILVESKSVPPEFYVSPASAEAVAQRLHAIRQVALSRTRLEEVIKKLDPYPEMAGEPSHVVVDAMRRAIEIRVQGQDSFMFEYVNRDPRKAMQVTDMLTAQFLQDADSLRVRLGERAFQLLQNNLEHARKALEDRDQSLRRFVQQNWRALPEQLDANLRTVQQFQLEQQTISENLRTLENRRAALERTLVEGKRLAGAPAAGPSGAELELMKARHEYRSLRGRYTDGHPDVRAVLAQIERLEGQIAAQKAGLRETQTLTEVEAESIRQSLLPVEAEIAGLKARSAQIDKSVVEIQGYIEATPKNRQQMEVLSRDLSQLREDYTTALRKEKDAEMARRLEEFWKHGYFHVLDPAFLPGRPVLPYTQLFMLGGLLLGLGTGLLSAFIADLLDRSVKTERELKELFPYPLLATVPPASRVRKA